MSIEEKEAAATKEEVGLIARERRGDGENKIRGSNAG